MSHDTRQDYEKLQNSTERTEEYEIQTVHKYVFQCLIFIIFLTLKSELFTLISACKGVKRILKKIKTKKGMSAIRKEKESGNGKEGESEN